MADSPTLDISKLHTVHFTVDVLKTKQHGKLLTKVEEMVHIDPMEFFPEHWLFLDIDFYEQLAEGAAEDK